MNHIEITIPVSNEATQEILVALLENLGYEGFETNETIIKAYIAKELFVASEVQEILTQFELSYEQNTIEKQNWNAVWESNFDSVIVDDFVGIRAHFHQPIQNVQHQILITPKMSFGTGHHATTFSVMQLMRTINFVNKTVFDFGTGTGILAILAEKLGATKVVAVDHDDWCIENGIENVQANYCNNISVIKADTAQTIEQFDIVIANINKNIILENLAELHQAINDNGCIILSGLLIEDEADILTSTAVYKWQHKQTIIKGNWIAIHFTI